MSVIALLEVGFVYAGQVQKYSVFQYKLDCLKTLQCVQGFAECRWAMSKTKVNAILSKFYGIFILFILGFGGYSDAIRLQFVDFVSSKKIDAGDSEFGDKDQAEKWRQQVETTAIKFGFYNIGKLVCYVEEIKCGKLRISVFIIVFQDSMIKIIGFTVVEFETEIFIIFIFSLLKVYRKKSLYMLLLVDKILSIYLKKVRGCVAAK